MSHTTRLLVEEITVSLSHQWKNPKGNMTRISFQNWEQSPAGYLIKFGEFFLRTLKCFIHVNGALSFSLLFLTASVLLIHSPPVRFLWMSEAHLWKHKYRWHKWYLLRCSYVTLKCLFKSSASYKTTLLKICHFSFSLSSFSIVHNWSNCLFYIEEITVACQYFQTRY